MRISLQSRAVGVVSAAVVVALGITAAPASSAPPAADPAGSHQAAASPEDCQLLPANVYNEHEGPTDYERWLRPTGTLRGIVLFVRFPGEPSPSTDELEDRTELFSQAPDWFSHSSYGEVTLDLTFDTVWREMPNQQSTYSNDTFDLQRTIVQDAVNSADTAIDFSPYDLIYVVAPANAWALPDSPSFIAGVGWGVWADGVELRYGATFGQDVSYWGYEILNHETGHVFGLPDLYQFTADDYHKPAGGWDVMGLITGPAPDLLAWHKWKLGWLDDNQIVCQEDSTSMPVTLTPLGTNGGTKALVVPRGDRDAVVVENRQVSQLDEDTDCFQAGVLVYQVTTTVGGGGIPPGSNTPDPDGPRPIRIADHLPNSAIPDCDSRAAELANATLTAEGHTITVDGVTVEVTGHSGSDRSVEVTVS
jgi:M6 family metalloprotease-like protein